MSYFGFDTTRAPFDDVRVRRAFALALDRERLVPLAEGASSTAAASLVPPAIWPEGFAPGARARRRRGATPARRGRVCEPGRPRHDRGQRRRPRRRPAVEMWREELGVDIDDRDDGLRRLLRSLDSKPPGIFTVNWIADYPSPHAIYGLLLDPGAASNYGDWQDDRFAELLEEAARAPESTRSGPHTTRSTPTCRAGSGHPLVVRRDLVARRRRAARPRQPHHRPHRLREGVVGRLTRSLAPVALAGALARSRAEAVAAFDGFGASSADSTYGQEIRFDDDPERRQPRSARALIRTPGADGSLVVPVPRRDPPPSTCGTPRSTTSSRTR